MQQIKNRITLNLINTVLIFTIISVFTVSCDDHKASQQYTFNGKTMGTTYQVKISQALIGGAKVNIIKEKIDSSLVRVNKLMSTYDPSSEISKFNNFYDTTAFKISPEFARVVSTSLEIYRASQQAFDITVAPLVNLWGFGFKGSRDDLPSDKEIEKILNRIGSDNLEVIESKYLKKKIPDLQIDLSAIAKGYGVDVVAGLVQSLGYKNFMVEIGGEVVAHGVNAKKELWKIGIDRPKYAVLPGQELETILALSNVAVATSGDYRNFFKINDKTYSHTINPKTGRPVTHNLASATIVAPACMQADGLATAVMVLGKKISIEWIESIPDVEVLLIVRDGEDSFTEYQSSGFSKYLLKN